MGEAAAIDRRWAAIALFSRTTPVMANPTDSLPFLWMQLTQLTANYVAANAVHIFWVGQRPVAR